jgi:NitT/TauT family transport system ATP-binding protein
MTTERPLGAGTVAVGESQVPGQPGPREILDVDDVTLRFPGAQRPAIQHVSFRVSEGKFVAVIGPSGCGKSTLLNLSAGLIKPTRGEIHFNGKRVHGVNTDAAYITQAANLLPWLTVRGNIGLGLKFRGTPAAEREERIARWVDLVGLNGFEDNFPRELSGGMQKRCSIARALIYDPSIVLMDEPFGPLDAILRLRLQQELLNIWDSNSGTVVFVTHDLTEAICLADEVVVMSRGPGTVRGVVPIPIERPRDVVSVMESPEFAELYAELWELFKSEIGPVKGA